jgi:hypothetical protein
VANAWSLWAKAQLGWPRIGLIPKLLRLNILPRDSGDVLVRSVEIPPCWSLLAIPWPLIPAAAIFAWVRVAIINSFAVIVYELSWFLARWYATCF